MEKNDTPGGSRGQGTVVWADDRDPITAATLHDAALVAGVSASSHVGRVVPPLAERELLGVAARTDERTMMSSPLLAVRGIVVVGPGSGSSLRCVRGHFMKWLPKPGDAA